MGSQEYVGNTGVYTEAWHPEFIQSKLQTAVIVYESL